MIFAVIPAVRRSVLEVIENLLDQRLPPSKVMVVDNSLSLGKRILELFGRRGVDVITPPENLGSAGGYALGFSECLKHQDCRYIFTSDDDVLYEKDAILVLYDNLVRLPDAGAVRCAWEGYSGRTKQVRTSVWTGVLIKREVVESIGLPEKSLFLYADDVEFFLRMNRKKFKLYIVKGARYLRRYRDNRTRRGFYSNPSRLYYALRNEIYVGMRYDRLMVLKALGYFLKNVLFMDGRSIVSSLEGIRDGFLGRLGKNRKYSVLP